MSNHPGINYVMNREFTVSLGSLLGFLLVAIIGFITVSMVFGTERAEATSKTQIELPTVPTAKVTADLSLMAIFNDYNDQLTTIHHGDTHNEVPANSIGSAASNSMYGYPTASCTDTPGQTTASGSHGTGEEPNPSCTT